MDEAALNAMVAFGADGPDGAGGAVVNGSTAAFQITWIFGAHPPHPYWALR